MRFVIILPLLCLACQGWRQAAKYQKAYDEEVRYAQSLEEEFNQWVERSGP